MNKNGLSSQEVLDSRDKHGSNALPESKSATFWDEFKGAFVDPMICLLMIIAVVMFIMWCFGYAEIYESIGIIGTVILVAVVTAKTNVASDTAYRKTKASVKKDVVKVYRDEVLQEVVIDDIVVGDLVSLQSGDKVPADGVIVEGNVKVDNSALNGESDECKKSASDSVKFPEQVTGDTFIDKSTLFRGAVVTDGECLCEVCKVGIETVMGKMAEEMQQEEPDSPLKVKLGKLAKQISVFGYVGAVLIMLFVLATDVMSAGGFGAFFSQDIVTISKTFFEAFSLAVVIVVCAVPEGLPLMISLVLMQNTSRMLEKNVLVRKAIGIETAGSLNILFSDKTGTITQGKLSVVETFTADGKTVELDYYRGSREIMYAIAKNTQASFDGDNNIVGGNLTDKALLKYLGAYAFREISDNGDEVVASQAFNSSNKFSQAQVGKRTYYKGAPEKLIEKATKYLDSNGEVKNIDEAVLTKKIDELAERSMRVLAFGYSDAEMTENSINDDVVISGLVGIRDDVRPDAVKAIKEIQDAGIQLVMITGDRLETARAIAKDSGLIKSDDDIVITSKQLGGMSDDEVKAILPKIRVIARALPTDKSRMVRLSQELNLVAGMTGDGVNDSSALKLADVGFAMGSGTDAAKEASKIVILDDSLMSIADAILYGRTIYHNILKFCNFQLAINVCAVIVNVIAPFVGVAEPLKVTHLLFVNIVMDALGALMLGNEPALDEYMVEKPRRRDENIISKSMAVRILWEAVWMIALSFMYLKLSFFVNRFDSQEQHLTGYFVMFIVTALLNGFNVRDRRFGILSNLSKNKNFIKIMCLIAFIQFCIVYSGVLPVVGIIGKMFSCVPISLVNYGMIILLSATVIPVDLLRKLLMERK